jgi:hypothetical protein
MALNILEDLPIELFEMIVGYVGFVDLPHFLNIAKRIKVGTFFFSGPELIMLGTF